MEKVGVEAKKKSVKQRLVLDLLMKPSLAKEPERAQLIHAQSDPDLSSKTNWLFQPPNHSYSNAKYRVVLVLSYLLANRILLCVLSRHHYRVCATASDTVSFF